MGYDNIVQLRELSRCLRLGIYFFTSPKTIMLKKNELFPKPYWDLKKLFIPPLLAILLIWSWLSSSIRPLWDKLDSNAFHFFNSWIVQDPIWQNFWAFAGHRTMDWFHDIIMFFFFYYHIKFAKTLKRRRIAEFIFSLLLITLVIWIIHAFAPFFHLHRKSPTIIESTAFRLSHVIDWIHVKDFSKKSFPSDHAITALLFTSLVFNFMDSKKRWLASIYAIFFCLPRLVAGAHWLTDIVIGSFSIVLLVMSLALGTPFATWVVNTIEKGMQKILFQLKRRIAE